MVQGNCPSNSETPGLFIDIMVQHVCICDGSRGFITKEFNCGC